LHVRAAVEAGKHVFAEKPMAVDMAGVKSIIKSAEMAKKNNTAIQHGYCWRFSPANRIAFERAHSGELGAIRGFYGTYLGSPVRALAPDAMKPDGMGDVEWQLSKWINFEWLSGGPLLEQCIHVVDKVAWAMGDVAPIAAVGNGGRGQRTDAGNVYDNYSIAYEYPGGVFCHVLQRQYAGCHNENISRIICENGNVIGPWKVSIQDKAGETSWKYREKRGEEQNMYQVCHNEFFAALRKGEIINAGKYMADSTALGILGREAAHTGQRVTWEDLWKSDEDMAPDDLVFNDKFPVPPPPVPGEDQFA
ncbi:MAG: Gfo/Idh/MocA family oxidoreductase, partial [Akkermansiaceae bacterium]|nr:Gfo/Idh/MocA family oxidoreductase [Akkermansiaceae bacterium]